jgi:hypothetical protein
LNDPPYRVVTKRLVVRCWEPRDAPPLVPRKLDLAEEARLRRRLPAEEGGEPRDAIVFTLFRVEFAPTPASSAEFDVYDALGARVWPL